VLQTDLLRYTVDVLERLDIVHMVVGSMASGAYGEPRLTLDIDIVVEMSAKEVPDFCAAFVAPEFYVSEAAVREAVRSRFKFNVLHPASGNKIDFMFPTNDMWGRTQLERRQRVYLLPDRESFTASPEDVIISKLRYFAEGGSEKHLRDVTGILRIRGSQVDRRIIAHWAQALGLDRVWKTAESRADDPST